MSPLSTSGARSTHRAIRGSLLLLLSGLLLLVWPEPAEPQAAPEPLTIDEIMQLRSVVGGRESPKWSPDGSRIVFPSSGYGTPEDLALYGSGLVSIDLETGFPRRVPLDLRGGRDPRFSPDGSMVSYISNRTGSDEIWVWSVTESRDRRITHLGGTINNTVQWSPDGQWIAFSGNHRGVLDVWRVHVATGRTERLTADARDEVYPTWTPDGRHIVFVRLDARRVDHDVLTIPSSGGEPRLIVSDTDFFDWGDYGHGWVFGRPHVSPDGRLILFRSQRSGWINYWLVPFEGGAPRALSPEEADQGEARFAPDGSRVVFSSNRNGTRVLRIAAVDGSGSVPLVEHDLGVAESPEWSPDGTSVSYTFSRFDQPRDLFVVHVESGRTRRLTQSLPEGGLSERLMQPEKVTYLARDGLEIQAYLTRPSHVPAGTRLPVIVIIHGGYKSSGHWQFDDGFLQQRNTSQPTVQFLVSNGYVVFQPNTRGSTGFGKAFEQATHGCMVHCELDDVLDGVEYLKWLPFVDGERIGITGQSYGGTLAMLAAGKAPGVFQASVPLSGFSDWYNGALSNYTIDYLRVYEYELGPFEENRDLYYDLSPLRFVPQVQTPMLVINGEGRPPLDMPDSQLFVNEMRRHGKPVRHRVFAGDGYFVGSHDNIRQLELDRLEFFNQFLKRANFP